MFAGRPALVVLAAAALGIVGVVTLGVVGPIVVDVIRCGQCSIGLDVMSILRLATPFVTIALAAGLLAQPSTVVRPAAVGSGLLAIGWIGPVAQESSPTLVMPVALALLSATPFLLLRPVGPGAGRWARLAWIAAILVALLLWLLDMSFSGFMQTTPVPPQMAFLGVAVVVLGAGLASGYVRRFGSGTGR